ncbi:hypothetical protein [Streptomyces sp. NPDC047000]|uniref:hypothetical protein n=1 Tax=Streptomyces sp. NPDC047000 TaxID=3155474 RepID=UPI0033E98D93
MLKKTGPVASAALAVASLLALGVAATASPDGGDIGWDHTETVSALHAPGLSARTAVASDNVIEGR